jgi:predicted alpha/beta hydrolase family esterase
LRAELEALDGERVVLCHSLACLLWMLHARDSNGRQADRVMLVAPPCAWDIPPVARFRPDGVTRSDIEEAAGRTEGICSTGDPYCTEGAYNAFPFLDLDVLSDAGHLNTDAGYGPWPTVERWALGES